MREIIEKIKERIAKGEKLIRDNEASYDLLKMTNPKADSNEQLKNEMHALNLLVKTDKEALDWVLSVIDDRYEDDKMPAVECCQKPVNQSISMLKQEKIELSENKEDSHKEYEEQTNVKNKQVEKVAKLVNDIKLTVDHLPLTGDLNMVSDAIIMLLDVGYALKESEFQKTVIQLKQILRDLEYFYHPQIPMLVEKETYIVRKREQNAEYDEFFKIYIIELTEYQIFAMDIDSNFKIRMSYKEFYNEFEIIELIKTYNESIKN